jgi:hypothetical protein
VRSALTPQRPALHPGLRTTGRWLARLLPLLGIAGGIAELGHVHTVKVVPALVGIGAWTLGNYVVSVLRWRSVSGRDLPLRWYARVFAESELLGLLTPQHAGALYWRGRQLKRRGADQAGMVAELAADRLCCCVSVLATLLLGSAALPQAEMLAVMLLVAVVAVLAVGTRRRWTHRLPTLEPRRAARWVGYSLLFQAAYVAFVLDAINAVGASIPAGSVLGLLAAAQIASILPGVHGAGPKEGVLAGGMVALGATHGAAIAAVGLLVSLVWVPALLLGGGGMLLRAVSASRARLRGRGLDAEPLGVLALPAPA